MSKISGDVAEYQRKEVEKNAEKNGIGKHCL
jgi:hypothetical protein